MCLIWLTSYLIAELKESPGMSIIPGILLFKDIKLIKNDTLRRWKKSLSKMDSRGLDKNQQIQLIDALIKANDKIEGLEADIFDMNQYM